MGNNTKSDASKLSNGAQSDLQKLLSVVIVFCPFGFHVPLSSRVGPLLQKTTNMINKRTQIVKNTTQEEKETHKIMSYRTLHVQARFWQCLEIQRVAALTGRRHFQYSNTESTPVTTCYPFGVERSLRLRPCRQAPWQPAEWQH